MSATEIDTVAEITRRVRPILAGHPAYIQGAVLADLLATWIAGHRAGKKTLELRAQMLEFHLKAVIAMVAIEDNANAV